MTGLAHDNLCIVRVLSALVETPYELIIKHIIATAVKDFLNIDD